MPHARGEVHLRAYSNNVSAVPWQLSVFVYNLDGIFEANPRRNVHFSSLISIWDVALLVKVVVNVNPNHNIIS